MAVRVKLQSKLQMTHLHSIPSSTLQERLGIRRVLCLQIGTPFPTSFVFNPHSSSTLATKMLRSCLGRIPLEVPSICTGCYAVAYTSTSSPILPRLPMNVSKLNLQSYSQYLESGTNSMTELTANLMLQLGLRRSSLARPRNMQKEELLRPVSNVMLYLLVVSLTNCMINWFGLKLEHDLAATSDSVCQAQQHYLQT